MNLRKKLKKSIIIGTIFVLTGSFAATAFAATTTAPAKKATPAPYSAAEIVQKEKDDALNKAKAAKEEALKKLEKEKKDFLTNLDKEKAAGISNANALAMMDRTLAEKNEPDSTKRAAKNFEIDEKLKKKLAEIEKEYQEELKQLNEGYEKEKKAIEKAEADVITSANKTFKDALEKGVPPPLYRFKSELLPGSSEISYRKYFIDQILPRAIQLLISLTAVAAVLFLIYGGYRLLFYAGEAEATEKAKGIIKWAIIGLLIALFSYFIVSFITSLANLAK